MPGNPKVTLLIIIIAVFFIAVLIGYLTAGTVSEQCIMPEDVGTVSGTPCPPYKEHP